LLSSQTGVSAVTPSSPSPQYALIFEGFTDNAVQYALLTRPADLRHAFLPFAHADGKLLRQTAVTRALSGSLMMSAVACFPPCQR
jgi:hypothetical protein